MKINSVQQLQELFNNNICDTDLKEDSYSKTIYIKESIFDNLIKFDLFFEPYISLAKECLMETLQIMKSTKQIDFILDLLILEGMVQYSK